MRLCAMLLLTALSAVAAEPQPACPFWDGAESIEQYAQRANLPPIKTLDLGPSTALGTGDGVKLELVLIPAGKFTMGTEEPPPVDEEGYRSKILTGQVILPVGGGALLILLGVVLTRAIRKRQRPQYSLAWFLAMTVAAGIGLLGGLHWHFSARALADAQREYEAALARFKSSDDVEKPAHEVTISTPFYIGKFEVTQEQYQQVMGINPSGFRGRDLPVEQVSWNDAREFCKKVSEKAGATVRLPSEAEWERACRAGTKTTYCAGDSAADLDRVAWYDNNSKNTTHPVGQKEPSAWGVQDMHGNVWEWCADWYDTYRAEAVVDPHGPAEGQYRVLRGGSWVGNPGGCRSADRGGYNPGNRYVIIGFRVVWLVPRTP